MEGELRLVGSRVVGFGEGLHWWGSWVAWGSPKIWGYPAYPPMIASWPAGIKQPERIVDDLVEFCELMPTLCEVTFETR